MGWEISPEGMLNVVYASASRVHIRDDDKLPDQKIWGSEDYYDVNGDEELVEALQLRFKKNKVRWELFTTPLADLYWICSIYYVDWPVNISKALLERLIEYLKLIEKDNQSVSAIGLWEIAYELAVPVDRIEEDQANSYTSLVQKELDRVTELYGYKDA